MSQGTQMLVPKLDDPSLFPVTHMVEKTIIQAVL